MQMQFASLRMQKSASLKKAINLRHLALRMKDAEDANASSAASLDFSFKINELREDAMMQSPYRDIHAGCILCAAPSESSTARGVTSRQCSLANGQANRKAWFSRAWRCYALGEL